MTNTFALSLFALLVGCVLFHWSKPIGRFLLALSEAKHTFWLAWHNRGGKHTLQFVDTVEPASTDSVIMPDVISALVNMGMKTSDARRLVTEQTRGNDTFTSLFQRCAKANRRSA